MTRSRSLGIMFATLAVLGAIAALYLLNDPSRFMPCTATFTLLSVEPQDDFSFTVRYQVRQPGHTTLEMMPGLNESHHRGGWPSTSTREDIWKLLPEGTGAKPGSREVALKRLCVEIGKEYDVEPGIPLMLYSFTPMTGKPQSRTLKLTRHR